MIKVTDYIAKRLVERGVKDVFMISGGGAMHLNDSIGRCPDIKYYCNHHEQASAIAAEGYARTSGKMGVVIVTSGPGGLNTLTGVMGAWTDSVPVLYISGQVKYETTIGSVPKKGIRQLGDQEVDIISVVKPLTKCAVSISDPATIRYHLERAIYLATSGRKGPVWLDVPLNVQGAIVDEAGLKGYDGPGENAILDVKRLRRDAVKTAQLLRRAKRPVIVAGHGIRLSGTIGEFMDILERANCPVLSTFNGMDIVPSGHPLFVGRIGTIGDRAGNFALQNADIALFLGTRNNIRQASYNWGCFASKAVKVVVDIDPAELQKPTVKAETGLNYDLKVFLPALEEALKDEKLDFKEWLAWCIERRRRYPVILQEYFKEGGYVNPYHFVGELSVAMDKGDVLVAGNGTACVAAFQAAVVKEGARFFWNSGCASMGYDLPAAIGATIAAKSPVICLAGDGSLQMNIQELQTVANYGLPIRLFYLNNQGYSSIKQTQDSFFGGRRVACDPSSGVTFPDIEKIAAAYGIDFLRIEDGNDLGLNIRRALAVKGPVICEVLLDPDANFAPKLSSEKLPDGRMISKPLHDMYPFLPREEFKENVIYRKGKR